MSAFVKISSSKLIDRFPGLEGPSLELETLLVSFGVLSWGEI